MKKLDHKLHILFCSRLEKEKGAQVLIDVIKKTIFDPFFSENIIWHITNDGEYRNEIEKLTFGSGGKCIYYGKVSQQKLAELYRQVDILFMPSHFLETFGLTALEATACGAKVMGIKKGGLIDFVSDELALDESSIVESTMTLFKNILEDKISPELPDIESFTRGSWDKKIKSIFKDGTNIFLLHDYLHRIGGAEVYVEFLCDQLPKLGYEIRRGSYSSITNPMKRRWMFALSFFAIWRERIVNGLLEKSKPDLIWMHSVLRYFGFWGMLAVRNYSQIKHIPVFLSHHDVGFIAPFPQDVYSELQIPINRTLSEFLKFTAGGKKVKAFFKWIYIQMIRSVLPIKRTHIIFSPFLKQHIEHHFPGDEIILLPHTFDENVFHL